MRICKYLRIDFSCRFFFNNVIDLQVPKEVNFLTSSTTVSF